MQNLNLKQIARIRESFIVPGEQEEVDDIVLKSHNSGLVQKRVQINGKNGPYYAIRWVDPGTGKSNKPVHPKYQHEDDIEGSSESEKIENIVNSNLKPNEKARKLVSLGILNRKQITDLVGGTFSNYDAKLTLKEAGHSNPDEFSINETLPLEKDPSNPTDLEGAEGQSMAISRIAELFGNKKAFEAQRGMREQLQKELNLTVDDKWESYEDDLTMLLDGELGLRAVMGYGTGGVGKTYTLEEKIFPARRMIEFDRELDMEPGGEDYDYVKIGGKVGSKEIQRLMYNHSNKVIVFDDCDSMWDDDGLINVLKNALDTSGKGKTDWAMPLNETVKGKGDGVPSSFTFSGRMIFITNKTKQELAAAGAAAIVESRCASTDLSMNQEQTLDRLKKIAPFMKLKDENRNELSDVQDDDKRIAFEVFTEMADYGRIDQINTRVLTQLIAKARWARRSKGMSPDEVKEYVKKQMAKQLGI